MTARTVPNHQPTNDAGKPTGRRVYWRAFIYVGAVHLFAALLFAMFAIGAR